MNAPAAPNNKAIFLDRDNTLIHNDGDLGDPRQVRLIRGAAYAIGSLRQLGFQIVVVSNQGGVARGRFTEADVQSVHQRINRLVSEAIGSTGIDRFYFCPFHPEGTVPQYAKEHPWRKPQPGMLLQAADDLALNLRDCWMIGDQERDIEAGLAAECQTILIARDEVKTRAHFRATNLAEAASIIAQNRVRGRGLREAISGPMATQRALLEVAASTPPVPPPAPAVSAAPAPSIAGPASPLPPAPAPAAADTPVEIKSVRIQAKEPSGIISAPRGKPVFIYGAPRTGETLPAASTVPPPAPPRPVAPAQEATPATLPRPAEIPVSSAAPGLAPAPLAADDRVPKLLTEMLGELHALRQRPHEFSAGDMTAVLLLIAVFFAGLAAAIYLDPAAAQRWLIVALLAQMTIVGLIALTRRR